MKKLTVCILCALTVLSFASCNTDKEEAGSVEPVSSGTQVEVPNPFAECKTLDEAGSIAGFEISVPESLPNGFQDRTIRAMKGQMIELIYQTGDSEIRIRKAAGSEDISGDYNEYAESNTVEVDSLQVTMKGADGKVTLATWVDRDYSYSIRANSTVSGDEMAELIRMVK